MKARVFQPKPKDLKLQASKSKSKSKRKPIPLSSIIMNQQVLMFLNSSQPHSTLYNQVAAAPGEGVPKRRRRRRKNKEEANGSGIRKRKLTDEQVHLLETNFGHEHKLESQRKDQIASELGLDPRQVAVWFQNRRARWKNKKLEEEYSKLKSAHENVVVEKCQLEAEVLKLQEQLSEAEKEIERVSKQSNGAAAAAPSCDSFSSSSTMDANPLFLGEFGMEGIESLYYLYENTYIQGMEWVNNYDQ